MNRRFKAADYLNLFSIAITHGNWEMGGFFALMDDPLKI
jgi:hypothetical protein